MSKPDLIVVMGPSGCGKTRVGAQLAEILGVPMLEGDDFHPAANRAKMGAGVALTDGDRVAWLDLIESEITNYTATTVVLARSALTPYVQARLRAIASHSVRFFLLEVSRDVLTSRIEGRSSHFMPVSLLDSQLGALVTPHDARVFDGALSVDRIARQMAAQLTD